MSSLVLKNSITSARKCKNCSIMCLLQYQVTNIFLRLIKKTELTVGLPEIWDTLEIQKMKNCSEVPNFMGKMNFWSKCAEVSWLLRYSVFSVFTKISWPIFLSKLWKNWAGYNFFGDNPGFGLLHRFQKWSNFGKSIIQQLTYEQYAV